MAEIKECAHCGYPAIDASEIDDQGTLEICCSHCGSMMRGKDHDQLVADWNRRPAPENKALELDDEVDKWMRLEAKKEALCRAVEAKYDEINRYNVACTKQCDKLLNDNVVLKRALKMACNDTKDAGVIFPDVNYDYYIFKAREEMEK